LDHFYVQRTFPAAAKAAAEQMMGNIKDAFIQRLKTLEWMDIGVVDKAIEKAQKARPKIGYPPLVSNYIHKSPSSLKLPLYSFLIRK
jgi:putative endopeptidase